MPVNGVKFPLVMVISQTLKTVRVANIKTAKSWARGMVMANPG